ncbi:hypothetical protein OCD12_004770 [Salmonella enterica]|nr:hypothetical protein [Salmonella enterica]
MNNRAWINEALHLRFDKKVHGKQISKRINIPRTTLQSLFRRFARSGLNWPVPEHISPEQLEQLLYPGKSQQYEPVPTREIPEKRRRPNFSTEFKLHLVELSMQPDNSCSHVSIGLQAIAIVQKQAKTYRNSHLNGIKAPFNGIKTRKKGQKTAFLWGKKRYFFDELTPTSTNKYRLITTR